MIYIIIVDMILTMLITYIYHIQIVSYINSYDICQHKHTFPYVLSLN